jgi:hypothetical protein
MTTDWAVTTATERIKLDAQRQASTTFTVSNPGARTDRAVFDVEPGDGAAESWFTVESPQRQVRGGDSVSYVVQTSVPTGTPDGTYSFQARVYSADVPPEESSKLSGRITFDLVNPKPKPKPPWKLIAAAVAAVVVLGIVAWLVFGGGGSVTVPDVKGKTEADAVATLQGAGLSASIRHKQNPAATGVIVQNPVGGAEADEGSTVAIQVAVNLTAPVPVSPPNGMIFPAKTPVQPLTWQPVPGANAYVLTVTPLLCGSSGGPLVCKAGAVQKFESRDTSFTPKVDLGTGAAQMQWQVQATDDFGTPGPISRPSFFQIGF